MAPDAPIEPFTLHVPDARLETLKALLSASSLPDELPEAGWDLGVPLAEVKRLTAYWRDEFDWRKAEDRINQLPQFRTSIQAAGFDPVDVHFVHGRSKVPDAIPLLFVHGWPGSFIEVEKVLPLLTNGDGKSQPAFHVVAPSLPNFGFSGGVSKRGFGLAQYAETMVRLMKRLGYHEFVHQGGDWGMYVGRAIAVLYPEHLKASHLNMIRASAPTWTQHPMLAARHRLQRYSARDRAGFARSQWFRDEGTGYRLEQSTKPQTLGYALNDSPTGLLAWIYEKLHDWTDAYPWTPDDILIWVGIYWFSTAGPAASLRIYYEATHETPPPPSSPAARQTLPFVSRDRAQRYVPTVPLGLASFPRELTVVPETWARTLGPVVLYSENPHGGHFAATEHPEIIARDLRKMLAKGGPAYGCVKGRTGYRSQAKL